jgi:bacterial/archaeal transporter family protein
VSRFPWWLFALGSAGFAGLTAVFGKLGVAAINSNVATLLRVIVIGVFTACLVTLRREWVPFGSIAARTLWFLALSGLATGLSWLCYYRALQLAPASRVAPLDKLSVVVAVLLGVLLLGEPLDGRLLLGVALIVAGSLVLAT